MLFMSSSPDKEQEETKLTFWQLLQSTVAAAFGVQSSANRKRDFTRGKPTHFIVMGIIFTVLFVLVVLAVVNTVLP